MGNEEIIELEKIEGVILNILGFMIRDPDREFQGQFLDSVESIVEEKEGKCELCLGKHRLLFHASPLTLNFQGPKNVVNWIEETCRILGENGDVGTGRYIVGYKRRKKKEIEIYW